MKIQLIKTACLAACIPVSTTAATLAITLTPKAEANIIPETKLKLSNDKKTLYGFADGVTVDEIRKANYDTLQIPTDVTTIADYAFAYAFDNMSTNVNKLILNQKLEYIGAGAFLYDLAFSGQLDLSNTKVSHIGHDAFNYCSGLTGELKFPTTIKTIGANAFNSCYNFSSLKLQPSIEKIGDYAFADCRRIVTIDLVNSEGSEQEIPSWMSDRSFCFTNVGISAGAEGEEVDKYVSIYDASTPEQEWLDELKNKTNIPEDYKMNILTAMPEECLDIVNGELQGFVNGVTWSDYTYVKLPDSVTSIKDAAFFNVMAVANKRIHWEFNEGLQSIGAEAFAGCSSMNGTINLPEGVAIGSKAFKDCKNLSGTVVIPESITEIPEEMFINCININRVVLHDKITKIGSKAFNGCSRLREIDMSQVNGAKNLSEQWTESSNNEFSGISPYGVIYYPNEGPYGAMDDAENGTIRPELSKHFGFSDVDNWIRTQNRNFGKEFPYHTEDPILGMSYYMSGTELVGLRPEIRQGTPLNVNDYQIIRTPNTTKTIRGNAFIGTFEADYIGGVNEINWVLRFNNGLEEIGSHAFTNCTGIVGDVVLPNSLKTIGSHAFDGCSNITGIKFGKNVNTVGSNVLTLCTHLKCIDLSAFKDISAIERMDDNALAGLNDSRGGTVIVNCTAQQLVHWRATLIHKGMAPTWTVEMYNPTESEVC